jgi:hypothetical protein
MSTYSVSKLRLLENCSAESKSLKGRQQPGVHILTTASDSIRQQQQIYPKQAVVYPSWFIIAALRTVPAEENESIRSEPVVAVRSKMRGLSVGLSLLSLLLALLAMSMVQVVGAGQRDTDYKVTQSNSDAHYVTVKYCTS